MAKQEQPKFVIFQPNVKEYHICLEEKGKFLRWCSYYPPSLDIRFPRKVTRIKDITVNEIPKKGVFDKGTYQLAKSVAKGQTLKNSFGQKSFSFTLNGKTLKGRFAFKQVAGGTVLQKYKDKFAKEEDVLSGDLSRTISTMVPDYDESKITLHKLKAGKARNAKPEKEEPPVPEITSEKRIGKVTYQFEFYTSEGAPDICLITSDKGEVMVLKEQDGQWLLIPQIAGAILKRKNELSDHAKALSNILRNSAVDYG